MRPRIRLSPVHETRKPVKDLPVKSAEAESPKPAVDSTVGAAKAKGREVFASLGTELPLISSIR